MSDHKNVTHTIGLKPSAIVVLGIVSFGISIGLAGGWLYASFATSMALVGLGLVCFFYEESIVVRRQSVVVRVAFTFGAALLLSALFTAFRAFSHP